MLSRTLIAGITLVIILGHGAAGQEPGINPPSGQSNTANLEIRAQITAKRQTTLSSELEARIRRLTVREGDAFKQGQVLVEFDCALNEARLAHARAGLEGAEAKSNVQERLDEFSSGSKLELRMAEVDVKKAEANVRLMLAKMERCVINAPFTGRVAERTADEHQYVKAGTALLKILSADDLEVELMIPSRWLAWLKKDTAFQVQIDETGKTYPVKMVRLGARIDAVSQSVKAIGAIDGAFPELQPGMSGNALFQEPW